MNYPTDMRTWQSNDHFRFDTRFIPGRPPTICNGQLQGFIIEQEITTLRFYQLVPQPGSPLKPSMLAVQPETKEWLVTNRLGLERGQCC
jgi:hypothetical protein